MWEEVFSLEASAFIYICACGSKKKEKEKKICRKTRASVRFIILLEGNNDRVPYNKECASRLNQAVCALVGTFT